MKKSTMRVLALCLSAVALAGCEHGKFDMSDVSHAQYASDPEHGKLILPQGTAVHACFRCDNPPMLRRDTTDLYTLLMRGDVLHFSHSEYVRLLEWIKRGELIHAERSREPSSRSYYTLQFMDADDQVLMELDPMQDIATSFAAPGNRTRLKLQPHDLEQLRMLPVYSEFLRHEKGFHR